MEIEVSLAEENSELTQHAISDVMSPERPSFREEPLGKEPSPVHAVIDEQNEEIGSSAAPSSVECRPISPIGQLHYEEETVVEDLINEPISTLTSPEKTTELSQHLVQSNMTEDVELSQHVNELLKGNERSGSSVWMSRPGTVIERQNPNALPIAESEYSHSLDFHAESIDVQPIVDSRISIGDTIVHTQKPPIISSTPAMQKEDSRDKSDSGRASTDSGGFGGSKEEREMKEMLNVLKTDIESYSVPRDKPRVGSASSNASSKESGVASRCTQDNEKTVVFSQIPADSSVVSNVQDSFSSPPQHVPRNTGDSLGQKVAALLGHAPPPKDADSYVDSSNSAVANSTRESEREDIERITSQYRSLLRDEADGSGPIELNTSEESSVNIPAQIEPEVVNVVIEGKTEHSVHSVHSEGEASSAESEDGINRDVKSILMKYGHAFSDSENEVDRSFGMNRMDEKNFSKKIEDLVMGPGGDSLLGPLQAYDDPAKSMSLPNLADTSAESNTDVKRKLDVQESEDELGHRVRDILCNTSHLRKAKAESKASSIASSIDFGALEKDLNEIRVELDSLKSDSSSQKSGSSSYHNLPRAQGSSDVEDVVEDEPLRESNRPLVNLGVDPLLTSGVIPLDLALEIVHSGNYDSSGRPKVSLDGSLASQRFHNQSRVDSSINDVLENEECLVDSEVEDVIDQSRPPTAASGQSLSERVQNILERNSPPRQAYQYLEEANRQQERLMDRSDHEQSLDILKGALQSKDASYSVSPFRHMTPFNKLEGMRDLFSNKVQSMKQVEAPSIDVFTATAQEKREEFEREFDMRRQHIEHQQKIVEEEILQAALNRATPTDARLREIEEPRSSPTLWKEPPKKTEDGATGGATSSPSGLNTFDSGRLAALESRQSPTLIPYKFLTSEGVTPDYGFYFSTNRGACPGSPDEKTPSGTRTREDLEKSHRFQVQERSFKKAETWVNGNFSPGAFEGSAAKGEKKASSGGSVEDILSETSEQKFDFGTPKKAERTSDEKMAYTSTSDYHSAGQFSSLQAPVKESAIRKQREEVMRKFGYTKPLYASGSTFDSAERFEALPSDKQAPPDAYDEPARLSHAMDGLHGFSAYADQSTDQSDNSVNTNELLARIRGRSPPSPSQTSPSFKTLSPIPLESRETFLRSTSPSLPRIRPRSPPYHLIPGPDGPADDISLEQHFEELPGEDVEIPLPSRRESRREEDWVERRPVSPERRPVSPGPKRRPVSPGPERRPVSPERRPVSPGPEKRSVSPERRPASPERNLSVKFPNVVECSPDVIRKSPSRETFRSVDTSGQDSVREIRDREYHRLLETAQKLTGGESPEMRLPRNMEAAWQRFQEQRRSLELSRERRSMDSSKNSAKDISTDRSADQASDTSLSQRKNTTSEVSEASSAKEKERPDASGGPQHPRKMAWIIKDETLASVPEDSTLESVTSDLTTSSEVDSDGKVITRTSRKHLPDDPKLLKLQRKIAQQREKHRLDRHKEMHRQEKIQTMERLLRAQERALRDLQRQSDVSSSTLTGSDITDASTTLSLNETPYIEDEPIREEFERPAALQLQQVDYSRTERAPRRKHTSAAKRATSKKNKENEERKICKETQNQGTRGEMKVIKDRNNADVYIKRASTQDFGATCPTPVPEQSPKRKYNTISMISEGVQTVPLREDPPRLMSPSRRSHGTSPNRAENLHMFIPEAALKKRHKAPSRRQKPKPAVSWFVPVVKRNPPFKERQNETPAKFGSWILTEEDMKPALDQQRPSLPKRELKSKNMTSLQEAFERNKREFISASRERQKHVAIRAEERRVQELHQLERAKLFGFVPRKQANRDAHPISEHLFKPKQRFMTRQEMKEMTQRKYKKLPEVVRAAEDRKRTEQYRLNRLRAKLYQKKIQNMALKKPGPWLKA
ncbi:hypothetical protein CAPTEDRAFT_229158 [Capitella teleta]|uniref:ALMS motif domain-containing protein n=1 Tax=Capitella teleta TaxID=283909 RepID=R7UQH0_CAPTE|nr:hypothetical protein CAPTEDRAFT_229158 [Capitella teleta]|eukprot:ELU08440.1 hypothetical protein CAPTEDRAFT_229158 [Capitella teleta]